MPQPHLQNELHSKLRYRAEQSLTVKLDQREFRWEAPLKKKQQRKLLLNIFALLCGFVYFYAHAEEQNEPEFLSVTAERVDPKFGGQSIQFLIENKKEKRRAILTLNSSFLFGAQEKVRLGQFITDNVPRMEASRQILVNWHNGLRGEKQEYADLHPQQKGEIVAYVGGFRLDPSAPLRSDALSYMEKVWDLATWKARDAVEIVKIPKDPNIILHYRGSKNLRKKSSVTELQCQADGKTQLICLIPGYGTAYLMP